MEILALGTCAQALIFWAHCHLSSLMNRLYSLLTAALYISVVTSTTISEIQGNTSRSPLAGQRVSNVTGIVTAKGTDGFYLLGEKSTDIRVSNGLQVYTTSATIRNQVAVGDLITLSGRVDEFRSSSNPTYLFATEITSPSDIVVLSSNNTFPIVTLGKDRSPPTQYFSALDVGPEGYLSNPNNVSRVEEVNAVLDPTNYGLDFWESLEGQIVSIPSPTATGFQNRFGDFWMYGNWPVTGKNSRGGVTITQGRDGLPDGNPETIIVGSPLDGTKNPQVALGVKLSDINGPIVYQFGFYYVRPLTAPTVISTPTGVVPATKITTNPKEPCSVSFGSYNVENLSPKSAHLPTIASHIVDYLRTPDLLFLQEIQDNSGTTDDGTVAADITMSALAATIESISGVQYNFTSIDPVDGQDGGVPGGNIRTAYFYRPERIQLIPGAPAGGSLDAIQVRTDSKKKKVALNYNPGRIDPTNDAWIDTRKPLVAAWKTRNGKDFYTINVHLSSKGGSSSVQGDPRPPINSPIDIRTKQVESVAGFVQSILDVDPNAKIIASGDFNEYLQTRSVYASLTKLMTDFDEVIDIPEVERYSYVFDQNGQQLDHAFVSDQIRHHKKKADFEHIHVNTWAPSLSARISDHDPSVGKFFVCG